MRRLRLMVRHPEQRRHRTYRCGKIPGGGTSGVLRVSGATALTVRAAHALLVHEHSHWSYPCIGMALVDEATTIALQAQTRFVQLENQHAEPTFAKVKVYFGERPDFSVGMRFQYVLDHVIRVR